MVNENITDEQCIAKWRACLEIFKALIKGSPSPESIKDQLEGLKTTATNALELTGRQKRGYYSPLWQLFERGVWKYKNPSKYGLREVNHSCG